MRGESFRISETGERAPRVKEITSCGKGKKRRGGRKFFWKGKKGLQPSLEEGGSQGGCKKTINL